MRHAGCLLVPHVLSSSSVHTCCAVALLSDLLCMVSLSYGLVCCCFGYSWLQKRHTCVQGHSSQMWPTYSAGADASRIPLRLLQYSYIVFEGQGVCQSASL